MGKGVCHARGAAWQMAPGAAHSLALLIIIIIIIIRSQKTKKGEGGGLNKGGKLRMGLSFSSHTLLDRGAAHPQGSLHITSQDTRMPDNVYNMRDQDGVTEGGCHTLGGRGGQSAYDRDPLCPVVTVGCALKSKPQSPLWPRCVLRWY